MHQCWYSPGLPGLIAAKPEVDLVPNRFLRLHVKTFLLHICALLGHARLQNAGCQYLLLPSLKFMEMAIGGNERRAHGFAGEYEKGRVQLAGP